jgi:hypothetical protein
MILTCSECATEFHGRADATYCSPACRQKAYRARSVAERAPRDPADVGDTIRQAEDVNMLGMIGNNMLSAERLNNYLPGIKLLMAGTLSRMLADVEDSTERDLAAGRLTAAEKRKVERDMLRRSGPVRP